MLITTVQNLRYCRLLTDCLTAEEGENLAAAFDYSFAVCYERCLSPRFETLSKNACLIDLTDGAEAAFSRFHPTARNEVRRTEKMDALCFRTGIEVDFDAYYPFYAACEHARGWLPVPEDELRHSLVFTAYLDDKPFSGMSAYFHKNRLRVGRIYSLKKTHTDSRLNNLVYGSAARRIVFELCKYGAENGFTTLDLGGIDLRDPAKAGIARFKQSFGGEIAPVILARFARPCFSNALPQIRLAGYDLT